MSKTIGTLKSSSVIKRHSANPILTAQDIPYSSLLVFNAGVTKFNGKYIMVFRNDSGSIKEHQIENTNLGLAFSDDGIKWNVESNPCFELSDEEIICINDPRITVIDNRCYISFAVIGRHGIRGGIAFTDNFYNYEILYMSLPDNRNLVLFSEKINNKYVRLDRPFANYLRGKKDSFDIWMMDSPDLKYWGNSRLVLKANDIPYCNNKIGPGPPPIKTEEGWLTIFHTVDVDSSRGKNGWEESWDKRYCAGIMLLDLENPEKVIGLYKEPLLVPETSYETSGGFRNNVVFPCGMILEDSGEVKIYYGAGDTVECVASADVNYLLNLCLPANN